MSRAGTNLTLLCFSANPGLISLKCIYVVKGLMGDLSTVIIDIHAFRVKNPQWYMLHCNLPKVSQTCCWIEPGFLINVQRLQIS